MRYADPGASMPRTMLLVPLALALALLAPSSALAAVSVTKAELKSGTLRVEGAGAVPNATVTVSSAQSAASARADGAGAFRVEGSAFQSSTCTATVSDATSSTSTNLAGCTPASTPPPPTTSPRPAPVGPRAAFSSSTVTYGPQAVGTNSAPQTIRVTNTGTAPLFFSRMAQGGLNPLDFAETDDQCIGLSIAPGTSCTLTVIFKPTATGSRTATISVNTNAPNSPQVITFTGTGTSLAGPTPLSVDTTGMTCTAGACDLGSGFLVNDFFFASFSAVGDTAPPFTWSLAGGALPPGVTMFADGSMYGTATATGTYTFTVKVTDPNGKTATQAFRTTIAPTPAPGDPRCQHAPSSSNAALSGPAIAGRTPTGQAVGDQSTLTACGGYVTITANVKDVNLPNGTVLWVTMGRPIGTITISNGSGSMKPYVLNSDLRKKSIAIYRQPPQLAFNQTPLLSGPFI
jgi:hypothetical protein